MSASQLTVERLFANPPLAGDLPSAVRFAPDGQHLAWLQLAADDRERQDLYLFDVATETSRCLIDSGDLRQTGTLSDAEKAERERRRQFAGGVTAFHWLPCASALLAEIDGRVYRADLAGGGVRALTPEGLRQTNLSVAPDGGHVAFVRDYNLWILPLAADGEPNPQARALTEDGDELRHYGLPEFIAQEEMHRFDGYWWTADSSALIATRVDNSTVEASRRYEIDAEDFRVIEQRYPYAGAANATVELLLLPLDGGSRQSVAWADADDDYLARVKVQGNNLYVQNQSRDQKRLHLKRYQLSDLGATPEIVTTEQSDAWVDLHNNLTPVGERSCLWVSARDGADHLYFIDDQGGLRQLTDGEGRVEQVLHATEERALVSGWFDSPTRQGLYEIDFSDAEPRRRRLSEEGGWHQPSVAPDGQRWVDHWSSPSIPAALQLGRLDADGRVAHTPIAGGAIDAQHPYAPYLEAHEASEMGTIAAADGTRLHYRLTPPAERAPGARYPVVVYVYGGPGAQRVTEAWPPFMLQLFAARGIGVFELDNRGSANRDSAFQTALHMRLGTVEVEDQISGAQWLMGRDWVDPARIGVFGHSYGGYMTLMCMAKAPHIFKAGVSVALVSDWALYDTHYTERYLGTPQAEPDAYLASSVFPWLDNLTQLKDRSGALYCVHGMADDNVLFTHSTRLYKALQDRNIPFQMMAYPGSKHALQEASVSVHRFEALLHFFATQL
ncbi:MAG: DPP IV N-terminal domain-containing protein [Pseudomonadota bacterium]